MRRLFARNGHIEENVLWKFERYLSKELALDLLRSGSNVLAFYSKQDGWIGANKSFFDLFRFDNMEEFLKYHKSLRELFFTESEEIFKDDDTSWVEYIQDQKNGSYKVTIRINKEVRFFNVTVTHSFRFPELYIVELSDVTKLDLAIKKIKEIEYLKSTFLSRIGHELRTPMNGVLGFAELLSQTALDEKQQTYLTMLKRSSESLVFNIEALLALSQLQSGELQPSYQYIDILGHLEKVASHFTYIAYEGRSKLYTFIDPTLPLEILSDVKKIEQIVRALLQHSVDYTDRGEWIFLDVKVLSQSESGECEISFGVRHNGKGLTKEEIEAISKPFSSVSTKAFDIGLTLAAEYAQMLGSKLVIESDIDKGSSFKFTLRTFYKGKRGYDEFDHPKIHMLLLDPARQNGFNILAHYFKSFGFETRRFSSVHKELYEGADFVYVAASMKQAEQIEDLIKLQKSVPVILMQPLGEGLETRYLSYFDAILKEPFLPTRIYTQMLDVTSRKSTAPSQERVELKKHLHALVVEDNVINQRLIKIILEKRGIDVSTAADGQKGVDMALKEPYDIIFMDIDMPKKDGITATAEIKKYSKYNAKTPVVAFTAKALEGDREKLLSYGFDEYMSKPIQNEELEAILKKYFHKAQVSA